MAFLLQKRSTRKSHFWIIENQKFVKLQHVKVQTHFASFQKFRKIRSVISRSCNFFQDFSKQTTNFVKKTQNYNVALENQFTKVLLFYAKKSRPCYIRFGLNGAHINLHKVRVLKWSISDRQYQSYILVYLVFRPTFRFTIV